MNDRRDSAPRTIRFGVLADLHLAEPHTADDAWINPMRLGRSTSLLDAALRRLAQLDLDGLALLGDLTQDGTEPQLALLHARREAMRRCGDHLLSVSGNHDLPEPGHRVESVRHTEGEVRIGPVRIAAGRLEHDPVDGGYREARVPAPEVGHGEPTVWLSHFPVLDTGSALAVRGLPHPGDLINRADVAAALAGRRAPVIVLSGHLHLQLAVVEGPLLQLDHAALVEHPHALAVLELRVDGEGLDLTWETETLEPRASAAVDPLLAAPHERWRWQSGTWRRATA